MNLFSYFNKYHLASLVNNFLSSERILLSEAVKDVPICWASNFLRTPIFPLMLHLETGLKTLLISYLISSFDISKI